MSQTTGTRLHEVLRLAGASDDAQMDEQDTHRLSIAPESLRAALADRHTARVHVTGTLERRLVFLEREDGQWAVADLSGQPHDTRTWPAWTDGHLQLDTGRSWLSLAKLDEHIVYRFSRPQVLLAALYHPENFPLPRFPLGISDVARAARSTLLGTVSLADMQLGVVLDDLLTRVREDTPDILGVSATFGQHDLLIELLDAAYALDAPPTVIVGGSLTARNEGLLLGRYPDLLVARAGGEETMEALLGHWHGDLKRDQIPALGFNGVARGGGIAIGRRHTAKQVARDASADIFPELDLLPATFEYHGVAQLEASRGCTNFCSFCPRGHKGTWSGGAPDRLPWMLGEIRRVFDRYPEVARVLYLVDEEFIGAGPDAVERALSVAGVLKAAGFAWESSCRIDQVVHRGHDRAWHVERAQMWRTLVREQGLRRMLFGVESGVDSILSRFNKETTAEQNALAIRTLSVLGVPTRYTYITFDPLMTLAELKATHAFQGRDDLLLRPSPGPDRQDRGLTGSSHRPATRRNGHDRHRSRRAVAGRARGDAAPRARPVGIRNDMATDQHLRHLWNVRMFVEYVRLPGLNRMVSRISAGCWTIGGTAVNGGKPVGWDNVDAEAAYSGLVLAYQSGVTLFDTADVYGMGSSERLVGRLLSGVPRNSVMVSSKAGTSPVPPGTRTCLSSWAISSP